MSFEPHLDPAPPEFRKLFAGQALGHLDEFVLSWRTGGHPISWSGQAAIFEVWLAHGPTPLFYLHAPGNQTLACVHMDVTSSTEAGFPADLAIRLWNELADIGKVDENSHVPLSVPLGKFSRGDRKVFLAYALTIARQIACPPDFEF